MHFWDFQQHAICMNCIVVFQIIFINSLSNASNYKNLQPVIQFFQAQCSTKSSCSLKSNNYHSHQSYQYVNKNLQNFSSVTILLQCLCCYLPNATPVCTYPSHHIATPTSSFLKEKGNILL